MQYLVVHLHTVLTEALVIVGFPRSPVCERDLMMIRPREQTRETQIIQTDPHITGGWLTGQRGDVVRRAHKAIMCVEL